MGAAQQSTSFVSLHLAHNSPMRTREALLLRRCWPQEEGAGIRPDQSVHIDEQPDAPSEDLIAG